MCELPRNEEEKYAKLKSRCNKVERGNGKVEIVRRQDSVGNKWDSRMFEIKRDKDRLDKVEVTRYKSDVSK